MQGSNADLPTVFLSYSSQDRAFVQALVAGMSNAGVNIRWDRGFIGWGDGWVNRLQEELAACNGYMIVIGTGGVRRWVVPELEFAYKRYIDDGLPILPLLMDGVGTDKIPPFLSLQQARLLPADLAGFDFAGLTTQVVEAVQSTETESPVPSDICPFPGLEPYDEEHADFFFGRHADTLALLRRFGRSLDGRTRRWLRVEGPSGCGKSSLVRAGLVPAIRRGWLEETDSAIRWFVVILRPGTAPLVSLSVALERELGGLALGDNVRGYIRALRDTGGRADDLALLVRLAMGPSDRLFLVIDQFEEIFTLAKGEQEILRLDALLDGALVDGDCPLYLVTTLRSDFTGQFQLLPRLQEQFNVAGKYDVPSMGSTQMREVVRIPVKRAGFTWSDPGLPKQIVQDAVQKRAALTLISNLLSMLWEKARLRGDHVLRSDDYDELGGVAGALAKSADRLLDSLGRAGKVRARELLLALVKPEVERQDSRRAIDMETAIDAAGGGSQAKRIINRLSGLRESEGGLQPTPRLIVVSSETAEESGQESFRVDLVHEALLRLDVNGNPTWKTLRDWVDQRREELEHRELVEMLAREWSEEPWPHLNGLASGRRLRMFRQLTGLSRRAKRFIRRSQRWQRVRQLAIAALVVLVPLGIGNWWLHSIGWTPAQARSLLDAKLGKIYVPELVRIKEGIFTMGCDLERVCSEDDGGDRHWMRCCDPDELPRRDGVRIAPFLLGKYELTFDEYDQFALATGRELPPDDGKGRGRRPVAKISWNDAKEYTLWLRAQTGHRYDLPTEAQWEYAARSGHAATVPFGNGRACIDASEANFDNRRPWHGCPRDDFYRGQTVEVGSLPPTGFDLHDIHGNVWEWVRDCYKRDYKDASADGSNWHGADGGECQLRILRGGGYRDRSQRFLRASNRDTFYASHTSDDLGFRIMCHLGAGRADETADWHDETHKAGR